MLILFASGGCLQDAHNADKDFTFDNAHDPTSSGTSGITIALVAPGTNIAVIANNTGNPQDLTNWTLVDQTGSQTFTFPSFILASGSYVRVNKAAGTNTSVDLYASGITWSPGDLAVLSNTNPTAVSVCTVGSGC